MYQNDNFSPQTSHVDILEGRGLKNGAGNQALTFKLGLRTWSCCILVGIATKENDPNTSPKTEENQKIHMEHFEHIKNENATKKVKGESKCEGVDTF